MGWSPRPECWRLEPVPQSEPEPVSLAWQLVQSQVLRRLAFSRPVSLRAWRLVWRQRASRRLVWQPLASQQQAWPQPVWQRV